MTVEDSLHELDTASYFGVLKFGRSYTNLVYTFLTFPIGLALFIYSAVCLPLFTGLSVIVFGFILLYLYLWTLPKLMVAYGYLNKFFIGLPVPDKDYVPKIEGTFFTKAFNALKDKRIWKSLLYTLFLALPFGTFVFSLMTTLISLVIGLIGAPIAYVVQYFLGTGDVWIDWVMTHIPTWGIILVLVLAVIVGFGLIPAVLQLNNKLAIWHARMVHKALIR